MEYITPELVQKLIEIVFLIVVSILGYGAKKLVSMGETYLDAKLGAANFGLLKSFATTVVRGIEQSPAYKTWDGAKKKETAMVAIADFADDHGIPVDDAFLDHVLEEAVKEMKDQQTPLLDIGDFLFDIDPSNNEA